MKINQNQLDRAIDELSEKGYCVWDQFIETEIVNQLVDLANKERNDGEFKKAGIGKQILYQVVEEVRGDYIKWLDRTNEHQVIQEVLDNFMEVKEYLNQTCFLGLKDFETHFAIYPKNTFYKKHIDRFQKNAHRVISFVLYLNGQWEKGHGGELAIYQNGERHIIEPIGGRLLLFKSEIEHEVLLSHRDRYSVTGWMLDKDISLTFLP